MISRALFPRLLGEDFSALHPQVRAVHGGQSGRWKGRALVQRGGHPLARVLATLGRLPSTQGNGPLEVAIEARGGEEIWTRHFGVAGPMRSTLCNRNGLLVERMGALSLHFQVNVQGGGMSWHLRRAAVLGLPLPQRLFQVQARVSAGTGYRFFVAVAIAGIGELIRYEGELDLPAADASCA